MPSDTNKRKLFGLQVPRHPHIIRQLFVLPRLQPSRMLVRRQLTLGPSTNGNNLFSSVARAGINPQQAKASSLTGRAIRPCQTKAPTLR